MKNKKTVLNQLDRCYRAQYKLESELGKLSILFSEKSGIEGLSFSAQYMQGDGVLLSPIDNTIYSDHNISDLLVIRPEALIETLPIDSINDLSGGI